MTLTAEQQSRINGALRQTASRLGARFDSEAGPALHVTGPAIELLPFMRADGGVGALAMALCAGLERAIKALESPPTFARGPEFSNADDGTTGRVTWFAEMVPAPTVAASPA